MPESKDLVQSRDNLDLVKACAEFNANAWSGRLEGGYRFVAPWIGGVGINGSKKVDEKTGTNEIVPNCIWSSFMSRCLAPVMKVR